MTELLTAAQMRAIEQAAIESGEVTGLELMERAGQGVVEAILEEWPEYRTAPQAVCVMCGPGNNGGDGFVVARLLANLHWDVYLYFLGDTDKLPEDARANYDLWAAERSVEPLDQMLIRRLPTAIYVDALFGAGLNRPPDGETAELLRYLAGSGGDHAYFSDKMVSIDVPSGLCADSGKVLGMPDPDPCHSTAPYARLTVTFDSPKTGHYLTSGPDHCGKLVVKDIGLSAFREQDVHPTLPHRIVRPPKVRLNCHRPDVVDSRNKFSSNDPLWIKKGGCHKFLHGHAVVLSGPAYKTGAARLAARGALRVGAGLVTIAAPTGALAEIATHITAIMLDEIADLESIQQVLADPRIKCVCLGPGLGLDRAAFFVDQVLEEGFRKRDPLKVVLDADALSCFENSPENLFALLNKNCVLTPHMGEFGRIFPDIALKLSDPNSSYSKCDAARDAAERAGCTVLVKGADTVIANELGSIVVNSARYDRSAPWLATAGAGDVLAGFITGIAARGFPVFSAADIGARLHLECALSFGPGLIAEDIPEELPKVFRKLEI